MFHGLELLALKKYEIGLSNELLNLDFGQGAAKISKVKVRGRKKIADSARFEQMRTGSAKWADIFFDLQL